MGTFANHQAEFAAILWGLASANPSLHSTLVARNFLLDDRVIAARADSYLENGSPVSWSGWAKTHGIYESEKLWVVPADGNVPLPFGEVGPHGLPETFSMLGDDDDLSYASEELHLVRVESTIGLAHASSLDPFDLLNSLVEYLSGGHPTASGQLWLMSVLDAYASTQPMRPIFAGFAEDVLDILTAPAPPASQLAQLRDRLGLLHLDPSDGEALPLVVFRYPVGATPRVDGHARARLRSPTVLESGRSAAFCPSPSGTQLGTSVDLARESEWPAREVVHLPFRYSPEHLALAGLLHEPVSSTLHTCRERHLRWLQQRGPSGYGADTDGDLLRIEPGGL